MRNRHSLYFIGLLYLAIGLLTPARFALGQNKPPLVPQEQIESLESSFSDVQQVESSIRAKFAYRRLVRDAESLLAEYPSAPNRFEILGILFHSQKALISLDKTAENRDALLETCHRLSEAPDEYAAIRLDADLLLSQAEAARRGGDGRARAEALRLLVDRYQGTPVEAKVIRIAMTLALEAGEVSLIEYLSGLITDRFSNDLQMIAFLREKLPSTIIGAPFIATMLDSEGKTVRFPMDNLGRTTALFFWSKSGDGEEHLKQLSELTKDRPQTSEYRIAIVSVNLDDLPDAGESILRKHGLNWPALSLPGGRNSLAYQAYVRKDPRPVTISPTGVASLFIYGGNMHSQGYERWLRSSHARTWTDPYYGSCIQSLLTGEFLILDPQGSFDPALPPELKALSPTGASKLKRTGASVPEDKLKAIQACFTPAPVRYNPDFDTAKSGYEKAEALCRKTISAHPDAPDLWIVRNRCIVALMGLWKITLNNEYLKRASSEATAAIEAGYPEGTDAVARLCLARHALHATGVEPTAVINELAQSAPNSQSSGPALAAATLLSMEIGDRLLHEQYRRSLLEQHLDNPALWTLTAFLLDRYHRYWMVTEPFVSGRVHDRREGYALGHGQPDEFNRTVRSQFKSVDGKTIRIPEDTKGKWIVITFVPPDKLNELRTQSDPFAEDRPFHDVTHIGAVLDSEVDEVQAHLRKLKDPSAYPILLVPDGLEDPIARQLGFQAGVNTVVLRPDGKVATVIGGLTAKQMRRGVPFGNVIQWYDEAAVDEALAAGNLKEAQRIAFAYAPIEEPAPPDAKNAPQPKSISLAHRRSRAKVLMAMGDWKAALADAEAIHATLESQAAGLSMRTAELDEIEKLKATIASRLEQVTTDE